MQKSTIQSDLLLSESSLTKELPEKSLSNIGDAQKAPSLVDAHARKIPFSEMEPFQLSWYTHHDIKQRYPIDAIFVFAQALGWLAASTAIIIAFFIVHGASQVLAPETFVAHLHLLFARVLLACTLFSLLYWEFYRWTLEIRVVGFRLIFSYGVLWKTRRSLAIDPIMRIKVKQSQLDLLFNLYRIDMWLPGDSIGEKLVIPGLSKENAYNLHQFFTLELNRRISLAQGALDRESEMRITESIRGEALA
jgi:uncharacterized membrane protein YdbT with pleckstrin-like domain